MATTGLSVERVVSALMRSRPHANPIMLGTSGQQGVVDDWWVHEKGSSRLQHYMEDAHPRVTRFLESNDVWIDFLDEWIGPDSGGYYWPTTPAHMWWTPQYMATPDGEILSVRDDWQDWLDVASEHGMWIPAPITEHYIRDHADLDDLMKEHDHLPCDESQAGAIGVYRPDKTAPSGVHKVVWYVAYELHAVSSNHYSAETQMVDALDFLKEAEPGTYATLLKAHPEIDRIETDGAWLNTDKMGVDVEWGSWVIDAIEDTGLIWWEDGEPWAYFVEGELHAGN